MNRLIPRLRVIAITAALTCIALPGAIREASAYGSRSSSSSPFSGGYYNSRGAYVPVRYHSNTGGYSGDGYAPSSDYTSPGRGTPYSKYQPPIYGTLGAGTGFVQPYMRYDGTVVPGHYRAAAINR